MCLRSAHGSLTLVKVSVPPLSLNRYLPVTVQLWPGLGVSVIVEPEITYLPPPAGRPSQVSLTVPEPGVGKPTVQVPSSLPCSDLAPWPVILIWYFPRPPAARAAPTVVSDSSTAAMVVSRLIDSPSRGTAWSVSTVRRPAVAVVGSANGCGCSARRICRPRAVRLKEYVGSSCQGMLRHRHGGSFHACSGGCQAVSALRIASDSTSWSPQRCWWGSSCRYGLAIRFPPGRTRRWSVSCWRARWPFDVAGRWPPFSSSPRSCRCACWLAWGPTSRTPAE